MIGGVTTFSMEAFRYSCSYSLFFCCICVTGRSDLLLQDLQSRGVIRITRDPGLPDQVSNFRRRPFTVNIQPGAENLTHAVAEELEHVQGLLRIGTPTTTSAVLREELRAKSFLLNYNSDLNWFDRIVLGVQMRDVNKQL